MAIITWGQIKNILQGILDKATNIDTNGVKLSGSLALGHETLTLSSVGGFASIPTGAIKAEISIDDSGSDIRYWIDNTNPTTTQGHYKYSGDMFFLLPPNPLSHFKAIPVSGSATLQVTYY